MIALILNEVVESVFLTTIPDCIANNTYQKDTRPGCKLWYWHLGKPRRHVQVQGWCKFLSEFRRHKFWSKRRKRRIRRLLQRGGKCMNMAVRFCVRPWGHHQGSCTHSNNKEKRATADKFPREHSVPGGHLPTLQVLVVTPTQSAPSFAGAGLVQVLV